MAERQDRLVATMDRIRQRFGTEGIGHGADAGGVSRMTEVRKD